MVTISDKRFGELVAKSIALDVYKNIANGQYEVIRKQEEASVAGMAEIKRLREELAAVRAELEKSKANFRTSVNNTEYWMKSSDSANKNYQAALEEVEHWKNLYVQAHSYNKALEGVIESVKNSVNDL